MFYLPLKVDKKFFENRGILDPENSYLLKKDGPGETPERKRKGCLPEHNPFDDLKCFPFKEKSNKHCDSEDVKKVLDIEVLLANAALEAMTATFSGALGDGQNYLLYGETCYTKAHVYSWDLDYGFKPNRKDYSIYGCDHHGGQTVFQQYFFKNQEFLDNYNNKVGTVVATGSGKILEKAVNYLSHLDEGSPLKTLLDADPNFNDEYSFGSLITYLMERSKLISDDQLKAPNPMCVDPEMTTA